MKKLFGNLMFLLIVAGFVGGVYATYIYGEPQYRAWVFKKDIEELERIIYPDHSKFESIKAKLIKQIKEDQLPIPLDKMDEHMKINQDASGVVRATIKWTVHVDFYGYFPKDFEFEGEFAK